MTDLSSKGLHLVILFEAALGKDRVPRILGTVCGSSIRGALETARDLIKDERKKSREPADALPVRFALMEVKDGDLSVGCIALEPEGRDGPRLQAWLIPVECIPAGFRLDEIVQRLRRSTPSEQRRDLPVLGLSGVKFNT